MYTDLVIFSSCFIVLMAYYYLGKPSFILDEDKKEVSLQKSLTYGVSVSLLVTLAVWASRRYPRRKFKMAGCRSCSCTM